MYSEIEDIIAELNPLFEKAERERLWFFSAVEPDIIYFPPRQLREEMSQGRYVWGKDKWVLRNPIAVKAELAEMARVWNERYNSFDTCWQIEQRRVVSDAGVLSYFPKTPLHNDVVAVDEKFYKYNKGEDTWRECEEPEHKTSWTTIDIPHPQLSMVEFEDDGKV